MNCAWLRRTEPATYARVSRWVDLGAVLLQRWFRTNRTAYSVASWSGMLNRQTLDWDDEWLRILDLDRERLPALADYREALSGLIPAYARRWPALAKTPFFLPNNSPFDNFG